MIQGLFPDVHKIAQEAWWAGALTGFFAGLVLGLLILLWRNKQ